MENIVSLMKVIYFFLRQIFKRMQKEKKIFTISYEEILRI